MAQFAKLKYVSTYYCSYTIHHSLHTNIVEDTLTITNNYTFLFREKAKYDEIFSSLEQHNGKITGTLVTE